MFDVELFALPYDSITPPIQEEVIELFEDLISNGVTVYFCKWNISDPTETRTAVGRWTSFHGKFIVTDKTAMIFPPTLQGNQNWTVFWQ